MRTEFKVVAVVFAAILALEGVVRYFASVLDWDREHIHQFSELIGDLHDLPAPRIVFFGNSLMLHGLDLDATVPELDKASGLKCHAEKIVPVGTAIVDWIYLYETYFKKTGQHPEAIVVGFVAHHVPDVEEVKIRRLARHFCSPENIWPCLSDELDSFEMRALGFCSYNSAIFGDQLEVQLRVANALIPSYGHGSRMANGLLERAAKRKEESGEKTKPKTYTRLERFIALLKSAGVKAFFVPMPQPEVWDLDPELVRTIEASGMTLIDAREIETMGEEDFSDGYHLGETGKQKLSLFLGKRVGDALRP